MATGLFEVRRRKWKEKVPNEDSTVNDICEKLLKHLTLDCFLT